MTGGATDREEGATIIEASGVSLGYRSWLVLGAMVRPIRSLRRILSEEIMVGDPNLVLFEVAGLAGCPPPSATKISGPEGILKVEIVQFPPPSPPWSMHPQRCVEATKGHGGDAGQVRLKGMIVKEDGSTQIAHEGEMSSTDQSHIKPRSLTLMEEGGDTARDQQGVRSSDGQQDQRTVQSQKSPPLEPIHTLAQTEPTTRVNSQQGGQRGA